MSYRARLAVVFAGILVSGLAADGPLWAQGRMDGRFNKGRVPQVQLPELRLDGTVEEIRPGLLQILSNQGQPWMVRVLPNATVRVTGKATADLLGPGQAVGFIAEVDVRKSRVEQPVSKLIVFTPSPDWPLGASENSGTGASIFDKPKEKEKKGPPAAGFGPGAQGPGMDPGFGADAGPGPGAFGGDTRPGGRRSRSGPAGAGAKVAAPTQSLEIRGQITSFKNGKATLHVPNAPFRSALKIEIAENAEVEVDLSAPAALALAQKGDKVHARVQQIGERAGQATEIEVTLTQAVNSGQPAKRAPAKAERPPRAKRAAEPGDAPPGKEAKDEG